MIDRKGFLATTLLAPLLALKGKPKPEEVLVDKVNTKWKRLDYDGNFSTYEVTAGPDDMIYAVESGGSTLEVQVRHLEGSVWSRSRVIREGQPPSSYVWTPWLEEKAPNTW